MERSSGLFPRPQEMRSANNNRNYSIFFPFSRIDNMKPSRVHVREPKQDRFRLKSVGFIPRARSGCSIV